MFENMFYQVVKLVLVLAILFSLVLVIGIFSGWIGIGYLLFTIKTLLITFGLFIFHKTRSSVKRLNALHRYSALFTHILIIPIVVFSFFVISNSELSNNYWFYLNIILILFAGMALTNLFAELPMKKALKSLMILISLSVTALLILHMIGKFENGSVILYSIAGLFLTGTLLTFTSIQKKR